MCKFQKNVKITQKYVDIAHFWDYTMFANVRKAQNEEEIKWNSGPLLKGKDFLQIITNA